MLVGAGVLLDRLGGDLCLGSKEQNIYQNPICIFPKWTPKNGGLDCPGSGKSSDSWDKFEG